MEDRNRVDLKSCLFKSGNNVFHVVESHFCLFKDVGTHHIGVFGNPDLFQELFGHLPLDPIIDGGGQGPFLFFGVLAVHCVGVLLLVLVGLVQVVEGESEEFEDEGVGVDAVLDALFQRGRHHREHRVDADESFQVEAVQGLGVLVLLLDRENGLGLRAFGLGGLAFLLLAGFPGRRLGWPHALLGGALHAATAARVDAFAGLVVVVVLPLS